MNRKLKAQLTGKVSEVHQCYLNKSLQSKSFKKHTRCGKVGGVGNNYLPVHRVTLLNKESMLVKE